MADKESKMPEKPSVRRVKNPETFRERAVKASETSDKPSRGARVRSASSKVVSPVFTPIGRTSRSLGSKQPFKFLGKIFRFIGRILVPRYFRNSWRELRLVAWPSKKQSRDLTFAVLLFAVVFGGLIAIVDYGLDKLFKDILLK